MFSVLLCFVLFYSALSCSFCAVLFCFVASLRCIFCVLRFVLFCSGLVLVSSFLCCSVLFRSFAALNFVFCPLFCFVLFCFVAFFLFGFFFHVFLCSVLSVVSSFVLFCFALLCFIFKHLLSCHWDTVSSRWVRLKANGNLGQEVTLSERLAQPSAIGFYPPSCSPAIPTFTPDDVSFPAQSSGSRGVHDDRDVGGGVHHRERVFTDHRVLLPRRASSGR